ncbi:MAG: hypothetical protein ACXVEF_06140 [Polyangiales bacterium]
MKQLLVFAFLAAGAGAVGCMADPPPVASHAAAPAKPAAAEPLDELAKLTADDCRAWADHFSARLKDATQRRVAECDAKAGGPVASDAQDLAVADAEANRLHDVIVDQCSQQVGAKYPRKDAVCYLGAKKMEDWTSCKFESAFFVDYATVAKNHKKTFDERCRRVLEKKTGT